MKSIKHYIYPLAISALFAVGTTSCSDFLKEYSQDLAKVESWTDLDEVLLGDPARLEAIEEANKEFAEKVAKSDEYDAQYEKNFPESAKAIDAWQQQNGIDDETIDKAFVTLSEICANFIVGKFSPGTIEMIIKAQNYDNDIEQAQIEGEIAGRNAKIEEKLRKGKQGDGTVALDGKNGNPSDKPKRDLGALERYSDSKSIFERGGEKRISRR